MNERILEIALQAGFFPEKNWDHTKWHAAGHNELFEKFAELIVEECTDLALAEIVPDEEIDNSDDIEDRCYLRGNNGGIVDAVVAIRNNFRAEK